MLLKDTLEDLTIDILDCKIATNNKHHENVYEILFSITTNVECTCDNATINKFRNIYKKS